MALASASTHTDLPGQNRQTRFTASQSSLKISQLLSGFTDWQEIMAQSRTNDSASAFHSAAAQLYNTCIHKLAETPRYSAFYHSTAHIVLEYLDFILHRPS